MIAGARPSLGWRLVRERFADLSGQGARRLGGRWNSPGKAAVYLSEDAALSVLEVLVHLDLAPDLIPDDYVLMRISLQSADDASWVEEGPGEPLPLAETRRFGDAWLQEARSALLRVPSAIVPESANLVLNPAHPVVAALPTPTWRPFKFDPRLL